MTRNKRSSCQELECPSLYDACLWRGAGERPAHLIIVNSFPSSFSVGQDRPFCGHHGRLFKHILDFIRRYQKGRYADLQVYYTYSTLAALPAGAHEPSKKMLSACQSNLLNDVMSVRGVGDNLPILVPLGPVATRSLGLKFKNIYDVTGRVLTLSLTTPQGQRQYKVVPLMSMKDMQANPGKVNVEVASLLKATRLAYDGDIDTKLDLAELAKNYIYPKTIEEVRELVDYVVGYYNPETNIGPDDWLIGIDTETNTLFPHKEGAKVLMLSVAWDTGKAATILLDHDKGLYDPAEAWKHVSRLLLSPKPKTLHNAKFDLKFLERVHGKSVNRVVWDTMLGEHYLDEDKKGLYSLKKLTTIYTPAYEGYDEKLQEILRSADALDEDGRDAKGNLYITDPEIIERTANENIPEWLNEETWTALSVNIEKYEETKSKVVPHWVHPALSQKLVALEKTLAVPKAEKKPQPDVRAQISLLRKALRDDVKIVKSGLRNNISEMKKTLKIKKPNKKTPQKGGKRAEGFEEIPLDEILQYAAADADVTRLITKEQIRRINATGLAEDGNEIMNSFYLPATPVLGDMEFHGVKVDYEYLRHIESEITILLEEVTKELNSQFDPTINYKSMPQVSALMQELNFPALPGIEAGSSKKEALEKYELMYPKEDIRRIFASALLRHRSATKALGGFLVKLRRMSRMDGRIHSTLHLNGTSTGRLASSNPNMLNIPKIMCRITETTEDSAGEKTETVIHPGYNIKKVFVPSKPDHKIVNVDIKGAELRVYTVYSRDKRMIAAILNGDDIHSIACSQIYGIPYEEIVANKETDPEIADKRGRAKRVIFGTFYGAGPWKIAQQINSTVEEAEKIQEGLFNAFPALRAYVDGVKAAIRSRQFVKTIFGRCRRFRLAHLGGAYYGSACREAVNFLIQSTASDILLGQMCEMAEPLKHDLQGQLLITVYDSVVFEMPTKYVSQLKDFFDHYIVDRVKEKYDWLPVPFLYDYEVGDNYGEVYGLHEEDD